MKVVARHQHHFWPPSSPQINFALMLIEAACRRYFKDPLWDLELAFGSEGTHSRGSEHYKDDAIDIVLPSHDTAKRKTLLQRAQDALPDYQYDLVDEGTHWHLEWDPKRPMNWYKWKEPGRW